MIARQPVSNTFTEWSERDLSLGGSLAALFDPAERLITCLRPYNIVDCIVSVIRQLDALLTDKWTLTVPCSPARWNPSFGRLWPTATNRETG